MLFSAFHHLGCGERRAHGCKTEQNNQIIHFFTTPDVRKVVPAAEYDIGQILASEKVDCIIFTSPSTIPADLASLPAETAVAVIGPVTREAAQLLGLKPTIAPEESTVPTLVEAIRKYFAI